MKLAFSTNAFVRFPLPDAIASIRDAGYQGVEILADEPHAYPDSIDEVMTHNVLKMLEQTGMQVSSVNANCSFGYWKEPPPEPFFEPSLISPNPKHRADRQRLIIETIDFAREIGARNISITSGKCLGAMSPTRATAQFAESIKPILEHAEGAEIDIGVECEPGLLIEWVEELRGWIDRLGSKRLGANLDIGHSEVMGESIAKSIKLLGDRIWNLHIEDISERKHWHAIPGEGSIDWIAVRDALWEIKYDRFATVELYTHTADPLTAAKKSYDFLARLFS